MAGETLDSNYARAGYHASQVWGARPALILIDFAHAYFDPAAPLFGGEGCQSALEFGVAAARGRARLRTAGGADGGQIPQGRRGRRRVLPQGAAAVLLRRGRADASCSRKA